MTLSTRQLRLIAAFAGLNILLAVGGWMALVSPQRNDAASAAAQEQLAQTQLETLLGQNTGSHGPTKQPAIHTADLYSLDTALPSQEDQSGLLFELAHVAKAAGVDIISISPQAAQATPAGYTIVPINLNLDGSYYKLTGFLRNLRMLVSRQHGQLVANGPLFAVTSLTFSGSGADKADAPATVGLEAFYYGVTAGAAPPVDTTATDTTTTTGG